MKTRRDMLITLSSSVAAARAAKLDRITIDTNILSDLVKDAWELLDITEREKDKGK